MSKQICKYMLASERDALWGLTVTTIGYEEIAPNDEYPTHGHADGYYFNLERGRELNEYQLLYISEGRGEFHSTTVASAPLREGDLFLLFPGEWHSYHPDPKTGWKSYWIGFKGRNMDENYEPFIRNLRAKRPDVPIVMAGQCDVYCNGPTEKDVLLKSIYDKLVAEGWKNLVYLPKDAMYPDDLEGSVDGVQPNDYGMVALARAYGEAVSKALGLSAAHPCLPLRGK